VVAKERGVAIVLAMAVAALAAIAAAAILVSQSTWARHNELAATNAQAQLLAQAGIDWGRAILAEDRRSSPTDHLGEPWAMKLAPMQVERGWVEGAIEDAQSRFNINNLVRGGKVHPDQLAHFRRLLSILGLPGGLADAAADWIDSDDTPQPGGGAEDSYYLSLQPPYLAANRPLIDVAELALVKGFDESVLARLAPYITALPRYTQVNVNTAAPEVLAAVVDGLSLDAARGRAAQRERIYYRTTADFSSRLPASRPPPVEELTVSSDYFIVSIRATIGDAQSTGTALIARDGAWPAIIWRELR
jgi:general secretion pathway protein K